MELVRGAVAALLALAFVPGVPAGAAPTVDGELCDFVTTGLLADDGTETFVIDGGPLVAADLSDAVANPVTMTLRCSIQPGFDYRHTAPDAASASATGTGAVTLPPTPVEVALDPDEWWEFTYCTEVTAVDARGVTHRLYWDSARSGGENRFSTSDSALCAVSWCQQSMPSNCDPPPCEDEIHLHCSLVGFHTVNAVLDAVDAFFVDVVDPAVCPVLAGQFPPEGDVPGVWDCPPYST